MGSGVNQTQLDLQNDLLELKVDMSTLKVPLLEKKQNKRSRMVCFGYSGNQVSNGHFLVKVCHLHPWPPKRSR